MNNLVDLIAGERTRVVVVRHANGMKCLFEIPDGVFLEVGDEVLCDTRKGETKATCITHSLTCGKYGFDALVTLTGATLPLKKIIGKYELNRFGGIEE